MKRRRTIALMTLLFAGINANAQTGIGITRDGHLNTLLGFPTDFIDICITDIIRGYSRKPIPKTLPKTKSITIYHTSLEYNHITEDWKSTDESPTYIHFDENGNITEITYDDEHGKNITLMLYEYDGHRLKKINFNYSEPYYFIYDNNGYLSKMKHVGEYYPGELCEHQFFWTPQGTIGQIKCFKNGSLSHTSSYQITNNGRKYTIRNTPHYAFPPATFTQYECDEHGQITAYYSCNACKGFERYEYYFKNKYDENGNLIERLRYTKRDIGNYYDKGERYRYEYEFYK